jgi:hypothetical protein
MEYMPLPQFSVVQGVHLVYQVIRQQQLGRCGRPVRHLRAAAQTLYVHLIRARARCATGN